MTDEDTKRLQARNAQLEELVSKAAEAMGFIRFAAICWKLNGPTWNEEPGFAQKMTDALLKQEREIIQLKKDLADADLLLGEEWRIAVAAVNGDVKAQREKIIANLVAKADCRLQELKDADTSIRQWDRRTRELIANNDKLRLALQSRLHSIDDFHNGYVGCEGKPCDCDGCAEIHRLLKLS